MLTILSAAFVPFIMLVLGLGILLTKHKYDQTTREEEHARIKQHLNNKYGRGEK